MRKISVHYPEGATWPKERATKGNPVAHTKRYNAARQREVPFEMTGWPCRGPRQ